MEQTKNRNFCQYNRDYDQNLVELGEYRLAAKIFRYFARHMNYKNEVGFTMKSMEIIFETKRQHISEALRHLKKEGFIWIEKCGRYNKYILNPDIVWTSYGWQKGLCSFPKDIKVIPKTIYNFYDNPEAKSSEGFYKEEYVISSIKKARDFEERIKILKANEKAPLNTAKHPEEPKTNEFIF